MGRLDKYARGQKKEPRNQTVSTKLSESEHRRLTEYLEERNLSQSEALYLLIKEEMESTPKENLLETNEDEKKTKEAPKTQKVIKSKPKVIKGNYQAINSTKKPTKRKGTGMTPAQVQYLAQWKIDRKLPCPICNSWSIDHNFAKRHAKKHGEYENSYDFLKSHEEEIKVMHALERKNV